MNSAPQTRTAMFVTFGMVIIAALGVYGWLATSKVGTAAYLSILVSLSNTLGLIWNNFATGRTQRSVEHDVVPGMTAVQDQVEHSIVPQVSAIVDATDATVPHDAAETHEAQGGTSPPHPGTS